MRSEPRRLWFLTLLAAILGVLGGAAAWVLVHLIGLITNLALFHRWGWDLPSFADYHPDVWLFVAAAAGALVVAALARWAPAIRGHGIPEAMESVLTRQSRVAPRMAIAKPLSAAIAIGTGGPFGAEGPIIVTGGALGSTVGQLIRVTPSERKILLACGAAAGMSATFGAPLAAVVLAIELLLFEFSARAVLPLIVASAVAGGMHAALFGDGPLFTVPAHDFSGLGDLWLFGLLGLACGLLAVVICKGLFLVEHGFRRLPVSDFWHPVIGALGFAVVGLFVPRVLGTGYGAIEDVLSDRLAVGTLLALLLAKLLAWWLALGSGTSGGTLAPILLMSASFGGVLAALVDELAPGLGVSPGALALVAMAATFGACTGAAFTSIVFAFELTQDYAAILPIMLAAVLADLVASALLRENLMTEKLSRRGLGVPRGYEPDRLRTTFVRDVMTSAVVTIPADASADAARAVVDGGTHRVYPVVDASGACTGIVSRSDLLVEGDGDAPVADVASRDVVTVAPNDTVLAALERMADEDVDHLPVLEDEHLVGMCTRADVLRARSRAFEHDRLQPGALSSWTPWRPLVRRAE